MPFKCELTPGDSAQQNECIAFVSWIEDAWNCKNKMGHMLPADTAYLLASKDGVPGKIVTTFRCRLMQRGTTGTGDRIDKNTVLAIVAAEGEEISYGKPYSKFCRKQLITHPQ